MCVCFGPLQWFSGLSPGSLSDHMGCWDPTCVGCIKIKLLTALAKRIIFNYFYFGNKYCLLFIVNTVDCFIQSFKNERKMKEIRQGNESEQS